MTGMGIVCFHENLRTRGDLNVFDFECFRLVVLYALLIPYGNLIYLISVRVGDVLPDVTIVTVSFVRCQHSLAAVAVRVDSERYS